MNTSPVEEALRQVVPHEGDDEGIMSAMCGSVKFSQQPFGSDIHRIDGRQMDLNVLIMAKNEYMAYMVSILMRGLTEGLIAQHEAAISQSPNYVSEIDTYQRVLRQTKLWNSTIISKETDRILGGNRSIFPNLLAAIYVSQVKILASVRINKGASTVQITIPSNESFIHAVYIECARILFNNPLLIYIGKNLSPQKVCERNTNLRQVVSDGIWEAVRTMLPVKDILFEYLNGTMLQNTVFSMGDDFEAYMKSPYVSSVPRITEAPAEQPPQAPPAYDPLPPAPPAYDPPAYAPPAYAPPAYDPPAPADSLPDGDAFADLNIDADDPLQRIRVPPPPPPGRPRSSAREDPPEWPTRRPDPSVSEFKGGNGGDDGSGSEIPSDLDCSSSDDDGDEFSDDSAETEDDFAE